MSVSKTTFSHYNLKILRRKLQKNITYLPKKFSEFPPWGMKVFFNFIQVMQTDGNLVLYHKSDGRPLWSADTYGSGATDVFMQGGIIKTDEGLSD